MGGKHARRASLRRRLVRMIVFRASVSMAVLVGSLYLGLATGQRIVAYRQHRADRDAERPVPACIHSLPRGDALAAARRLHHHQRAVARLPECYRPPRQAQLDATALSPIKRVL
jgi:hypothetical protein